MKKYSISASAAVNIRYGIKAARNDIDSGMAKLPKLANEMIDTLGKLYGETSLIARAYERTMWAELVKERAKERAIEEEAIRFLMEGDMD